MKTLKSNFSFGEKCYIIRTKFNYLTKKEELTIEETEVNQVTFYEDGDIGYTYSQYSEKDKNIFKTKEKAEVALKEKNEIIKQEKVKARKEEREWKKAEAKEELEKAIAKAKKLGVK